MALPKYTEQPKRYIIKPIYSSPFADAPEWAQYEAQRAVARINIESVKAELTDEAAELRRKADRLMKLAGRL